MLLAKFRTSVNLTGFHVFALMHVLRYSIFVQAVTHSHKKLNVVVFDEGERKPNFDRWLSEVGIPA